MAIPSLTSLKMVLNTMMSKDINYYQSQCSVEIPRYDCTNVFPPFQKMLWDLNSVWDHGIGEEELNFPHVFFFVI